MDDDGCGGWRRRTTNAVYNFGMQRWGIRPTTPNDDDDGNYRRSPTAVIFIDEIDAVAKCRDGIGHGYSSIGGNDEREQTLNALLTELDGFHTPHHHHQNNGRYDEKDVAIILIAATNRRSILDPAILRPGRLDRHVLVSCPNSSGREAILKVHTRTVNLQHDSSGGGGNVDLAMLAREEYTADFSGAELKNVVNEAALAAVREGVGAVGQEHLLRAVERVKRIRQRSSSVDCVMGVGGGYR